MVEFYVEPNTTTIPLGRQGENLARTICFELSEMIEEYGAGTATLICLRSKDSAPYVCDTTQNGSMLSWTPTDTDTAYAGAGKCELRWSVGEVLAKSIVYNTVITPSISGDSVVPSEYESWYEALLEHISKYEIASDQIEANAENIATNTNDIAVLDGRVDEITTLPEGSTTGDAELADIRVGADGTIYPNAGDAVRGQVADLKADIGNLSDLETESKTDLVSAINEAAHGSGSGLDKTSIDLLESILRAAMYSSNQSSTITQLIEHLKSLLPVNNNIVVDGTTMTILELGVEPNNINGLYIQ